MPMPKLTEKTSALVVSYITIRRAIGISGLLLPVALGPGGWLLGIPIQDNLSSYYHTPLRDVFVGTICAIGVFLLCYRGHDWVESWTANIGCVAALAVALCPLDANSDPLVQRSIVGYVHTLAGGTFFLTLAFYSLVHFPRSAGSLQEGEPHPWERIALYRSSGVVILASMLAMSGYLLMLPAPWKSWLNDWNFLFWMEWVAVWSFAAAWLTKGRLIVAEIAVELLAMQREAFVAKFEHSREERSQAVPDTQPVPDTQGNDALTAAAPHAAQKTCANE